MAPVAAEKESPSHPCVVPVLFPSHHCPVLVPSLFWAHPIPVPPATASLVTMAGPRGQKVSKVFPSSHCRPLRRICQSRALTSLATVNPSTCSSAAASWGQRGPAYGGTPPRTPEVRRGPGQGGTSMCRPLFPMTAANSTSQSSSCGTEWGLGGPFPQGAWGWVPGYPRWCPGGARCHRRAR